MLCVEWSLLYTIALVAMKGLRQVLRIKLHPLVFLRMAVVAMAIAKPGTQRQKLLDVINYDVHRLDGLLSDTLPYQGLMMIWSQSRKSHWS